MAISKEMTKKDIKTVREILFPANIQKKLVYFLPTIHQFFSPISEAVIKSQELMD